MVESKASSSLFLTWISRARHQTALVAASGSDAHNCAGRENLPIAGRSEVAWEAFHGVRHKIRPNGSWVFAQIGPPASHGCWLLWCGPCRFRLQNCHLPSRIAVRTQRALSRLRPSTAAIWGCSVPTRRIWAAWTLGVAARSGRSNNVSGSSIRAENLGIRLAQGSDFQLKKGPPGESGAVAPTMLVGVCRQLS